MNALEFPLQMHDTVMSTYRSRLAAAGTIQNLSKRLAIQFLTGYPHPHIVAER
jgi:hypothetical protein